MNGRISKCLIGNYLDGANHSLIGVLSWHFPGGTEEISGYLASWPRFDLQLQHASVEHCSYTNLLALPTYV
jgi:hypothetical protein